MWRRWSLLHYYYNKLYFCSNSGFHYYYYCCSSLSLSLFNSTSRGRALSTVILVWIVVNDILESMVYSKERELFSIAGFKHREGAAMLLHLWPHQICFLYNDWSSLTLSVWPLHKIRSVVPNPRTAHQNQTQKQLTRWCRCFFKPSRRFKEVSPHRTDVFSFSQEVTSEVQVTFCLCCNMLVSWCDVRPGNGCMCTTNDVLLDFTNKFLDAGPRKLWHICLKKWLESMIRIVAPIIFIRFEGRKIQNSSTSQTDMLSWFIGSLWI